MHVKCTIAYATVFFFFGLGLFSHYLANQIELQLTSEDGDDIQSASANPEPEPLSSKLFPPELVELLSPKIFVQPDPVRYLARIVANKPYKEVLFLMNSIHTLWIKKIEFPPQYLPYANVLSELLKTRRNLEDARKTIIKLQNSSDSPFPSVPSGLLSPELSELFSTEIFTDEEPPFQILIRLANVPEDKVDNVRSESDKVFYKKEFPSMYFSYASDLKVYMWSRFNLSRLVQSVSKLRDITNITNSKLSTSV